MLGIALFLGFIFFTLLGLAGLVWAFSRGLRRY